MIYLALLRRYWYVVLSIIVLGMLAYAFHLYNDAQQELGAVRERIDTAQEVVNNANTITQASDDVSERTSVVAFCQCLRSARTPANCERYLPTGTDYSKSAPFCPKPNRSQ